MPLRRQMLTISWTTVLRSQAFRSISSTDWMTLAPCALPFLCRKRRIDGHLIRQCNVRHTINSFLRKIKNNTGVGKGNGNPGMAFLHHLTCTCQLTSNAVSQTNSPSNSHLGFQSSPPCLCFRHRRRFTATSILVRFSPRPSPGSRSNDGSHRRTAAKLKFMSIKYASLHVVKKTVVNLHTPAD